ncbi:MAG: peptidase C1 [Bacteroidetes bacterium]|nr:peptidase C1 [Bacteroidota bacterium]MBL7104917.1 peptidase C1 [Bacteroidales bacterium]
MKPFLLIILSVSLIVTVFAQEPIQKDKAVYKESQPGFYQETILKEVKDFESGDKKPEIKKYLSVDFSDKDFPVNIEDYTEFWHNPPLSQGKSGTCWCFASTALLESEVYRITGNEVKLSEMYFVYWEYIERARYFVQQRGNMHFNQGSEANAVIKLMKLYGAVPASAYTGKLSGQKFHNHSGMISEMKSYLNNVKKNNIWNKEEVVATIRDIMNHYMGEPPLMVTVNDKEYTPKEYVEQVLKINPDDYFSFMSTKSQTCNQKGELVEPDNWWHCKDYYNVKLDDFLSIFKNAVKNGYTISFCGDVSEPGYDRYAEVGIIPTFDIPPEYINEDSREYRINNNSTNDDHCLHIVGYLENENGWWFFIKDSSSSGFDGPNKGYRFIHEDYIKLKILTILVYKYGAKEVLDEIIK